MSPEAATSLLDTHIVIQALRRPEELSASARSIIESGQSVISVVSYWEVAIKSMKGRLDVGDPPTWWTEALEQLAATQLLLRPQHIAALYALPPIHKDPFDRMLVAQSIAEGLTLVTADAEIARYSVAGLKLVR